MDSIAAMHRRCRRVPERVALLLILWAAPAARAQVPARPSSDSVHVLLVTAHPDDDSDFSGSVYKLTHVLGGVVDLCVITNGEGGFRYSTLAEPLYHAKLTDERTGRALLPAIRKREVMAGGAIAGVRNFFFLDQRDQAYTQDVHEVLAHQWDSAAVVGHLTSLLASARYDFVFVLVPTTTTHGAHQAAAIAALAAVAAQPASQRPTTLAVGTFIKSAPITSFEVPKDYPVARLRADVAPLDFDRMQPFGYQDKLDYRIVGYWVIAEHKSQGLMQTTWNSVDVERYFFFAMDDDAAVDRARALFARLDDPTLRP